MRNNIKKKIKESLRNKKILILGFGREGQDSYFALRKLFPQRIFDISDRLELSKFSKKIQKILKSDKKLKLHLGGNYLKSLKNYDFVIKTPGIPPRILKPFLKKGVELTSQTKIFFDYCPGKIIGVTGTKGKGTTSSLIYEILKKGGHKVHLIGNVGKPVFQALLEAKKSDIFVYELSSHQLQNIKKSPNIAVLLNIYPEHLDYYKNFREYQKAKENITLHQKRGDYFIYNRDQKILREIAKKTKAQKISFSLKAKIIDLKKKDIPLKGKFNILNIMAAVLVAKVLNIPASKIKKAIKSFKPLPHRLEFVGKYKEIKFYNDSLATTPQSTQGAIEALNNKVETLILGGLDRGGVDFSDLAKKILKSKIKTLILFPDTGIKIWQEITLLKKARSLKAFFTRAMKEAVKIAYKKTGKGKICLLSPAAASFNLFRDFKERGDLFKKYIKYYAKKSS